MPSAQHHEVNQVTEGALIPKADSVLDGAAKQMMDEVFDYQGSRVMKNAQGPSHSLHGNEALNKAQKMVTIDSEGRMEVSPLFPTKKNGQVIGGDADSCKTHTQHSEMIKQFADTKDRPAGGQMLKKLDVTSIESDRR